VAVFNNELISAGYILRVADYFESRQVYKVQPVQASTTLPTHIISNQIIFYRADRIPEDAQARYFVLIYNDWNDNGVVTTVELQFRGEESRARTKVGLLRIMRLDMERTIWDLIPNQIVSLSQDYCSLGTDMEYYDHLKVTFPRDYNSILLALCDSALFPRISERFEHTPVFKKSLIREIAMR
jgi:hypothetical protein